MVNHTYINAQGSPTDITMTDAAHGYMTSAHRMLKALDVSAAPVAHAIRKNYTQDVNGQSTERSLETFMIMLARLNIGFLCDLEEGFNAIHKLKEIATLTDDADAAIGELSS